MMRQNIVGGLVAVLLSLGTQTTFAQEAPPSADDTDVQTIQGVEHELEKNGSSDMIAPVKTAPLKAPSVMNYKEVSESHDIDDTIVIQRNYMPKTERFQLFGGFTLAPNDVFYKTFGLQVRGAYHFSERWGAEVTGIFLSSSKSQELKDLESKQNAGAQNLVSPRSYFGIDAYFNSMYGKTAFYDRKIIPFEIYQSVGIGKMNTAISSNADAFHLGIGQLFSISRSETLRWDLSLILYQSQNINGANQSSNTLLLTVGYGRFFPEAQYR